MYKDKVRKLSDKKFNQVSLDELWTYIKARSKGKRNSTWIYTAILNLGCVKKRFFCIGKRDDKTLRELLNNIPSYEESYSDDFKSYRSIFKDSSTHIIGKNKYTNLNESLHCQMRHYLARLKRKTLSYSKSDNMLLYSIAILFIEKSWL